MKRLANPHLSNEYSPLEALALQALRRFGDMHAETTIGDVSLMFIEFANSIIDEVVAHPYWDSSNKIEYYVSIEDARGVPDPIMTAGLLMMYAEQQMSEKLKIYGPRFTHTMNLILYNNRYGNGRPNIIPVDQEEFDSGLDEQITSSGGG